MTWKACFSQRVHELLLDALTINLVLGVGSLLLTRRMGGGVARQTVNSSTTTLSSLQVVTVHIFPIACIETAGFPTEPACDCVILTLYAIRHMLMSDDPIPKM